MTSRGGAGCACRVCDPRQLGPVATRQGVAWAHGAAMYVADARRAEQDAAGAIVRGDGEETAAWWYGLARRRWAFAVADLLRALAGPP